MQYLNTEERLRLWEVAESQNHEHALILKLGFWHALRISEIVPSRMKDPNPDSGLRGHQIQDGWICVQRLKSSRRTMQPLHPDLVELKERARLNPNGFLFNVSRQRVDEFVKRYAKMAGLHHDKAHFHCAAKHSLAMELWNVTHSLGQIQSYLGHKSAASSLQYLSEVDHNKAIAAVEQIAA